MKARFKDENGKTVGAYFERLRLGSRPYFGGGIGNHQNADGSINVPTALQPYMGGVTKLEVK